MIAKDHTAFALIDLVNTQEMSLFDLLQTLSEEETHTGATSCVSLLDYAQRRLRPYDDLMAPTLVLAQNLIQCNQGNEPADNVILKGYAIFCGDQLADFLDQESARALNIVLNKIDSTDFIVKDTNNKNASLELMRSRAKIKPDYETLSATIEVQILLNLVEFENDNTDQNYLHTLENQLNIMVAQQIQNMVDTVQFKDSDVLLLGSAFYHEDPKKWEDIKDNWHEIYPTIPITVKVTSTIQCTYNLQSAIGE
jgi:spore germination protein KC